MCVFMVPVPERSQAFMNLPTPHIFYYECRSLVQGGDRGVRRNLMPENTHAHTLHGWKTMRI